MCFHVKLERLFNNPSRYFGDEFEYGFENNNSKHFCELIELGVNHYIYHILDLLSKEGVIANKNKPIVYFKEIRDEALFGDKEILGFMANNIRDKQDDMRWEEALLVFFEKKDNTIVLNRIDYSLSNADNTEVVGRKPTIEGDGGFNCYNKEKPLDALITNMIADKIIAGREQNIQKLKSIGY